MVFLIDFIGIWYYEDIWRIVMYFRCLCLVGKIRFVGGRIKYNGSIDKERLYDFICLGDR